MLVFRYDVVIISNGVKNNNNVGNVDVLKL